ncbi:MAG TPA: heparinase II/III family protein, partial [Methylomirabilota bacterium]|nr:heparinase II/III family protein [Methylomirabilota bacterium]
YEAKGEGPKAAGLPLDKYFRGAEVVTLRSEWENPKAVYVGFKAGDNKANHSHLDLGSFVFDALGVRWASDLGADNYNLPGYFGNQRWNYYRLRAEGQNTLVINPSAGPDQDPSASTRVVRFKSSPDAAYAIADLSPAYRKDARKVWRGLSLVKRNVLLVQDEVEADKPADIWWFMHTPAAVEIQKGGRSAELQQMGTRLRVEILSPEGATLQLVEAKPLPDSPHPERQAKNEGTRKLAIHLEGVKSCRLAVVLAPVLEDRGQSPVQFKLKTLADW